MWAMKELRANGFSKVDLWNAGAILLCSLICFITLLRVMESSSPGWELPAAQYFLVAFPSMCGPILFLLRGMSRQEWRPSRPWLAWLSLGAAWWIQVVGAWLAGFREVHATLAGQLCVALAAIGGLGAILASLVIGLWFTSVCIEVLTNDRPAVASSPVFWLCGIVSVLQVVILVAGFYFAEALM